MGHENSDQIYQVSFPGGRSPSIPPDVAHLCRLYPGPDKTFFLSETSRKVLETLQAPYRIVKKMGLKDSRVRIVIPLESILYELPATNVQAEVAALALSERKNGNPPAVVYCGRTREEIPESFLLDIPGGKRNYRWRWQTGREKKITFQDRFSKLRKKILDPDTRFVLSLGAGGLRFFAHSSLLKLIEALGVENKIEEIWGCSGGAIAGLLYVLGARQGEMEKLGYDIYNQKFNFPLSVSKLQVLLNLFWEWLFPFRSSNLQGFLDVQHSIREGVLRITKKKKPILPFYAIAYNMDLKRNEVLTPTAVPSSLYKGFVRHCSPMDAILASSAIPILFHPRTIAHRKKPFTYVDGSVSEEVPLISIYNKWLLDRKAGLTKKKKLFILAANLFPHVSSWPPLGHFLLRRFPVVKYLATAAKLADFVRQSRIDEQIQTIEKNPDASVVAISLPMENFSVLDPKAIPTVIEKAHGTFLKQLLRIEDGL
ncbi:MAG: patatin-like phospholipase family protein [bacterium]